MSKYDKTSLLTQAERLFVCLFRKRQKLLERQVLKALIFYFDNVISGAEKIINSFEMLRRDAMFLSNSRQSLTALSSANLTGLYVFYKSPVRD